MVSTDGSPKKTSWVPLPWWTSQSTIATRPSPCSRWAQRAAIAMLLKRQKPIARVALGVVARRPQDGERVAVAPVEHRGDRFEQAAGGEQHRVVRSRPRPRLVPELDAVLRARRIEHPGDVLRRVHEPQLVLRGEAGGQLVDVRERRPSPRGPAACARAAPGARTSPPSPTAAGGCPAPPAAGACSTQRSS